MADDDLEYHITFPSPTSSTLAPTDESEPYEDEVNGAGLYGGDPRNAGEKEPVVILLGWAGCKDKYLSKYSDMYDKKG